MNDGRLRERIRRAFDSASPGHWLRSETDRVVDAIEAELADAIGWRSMDSAPKDGTHILYRHQEGVGTLFWATFACSEDTDCWWDAEKDDEPYKPEGWLPMPPDEIVD